MRLIDADELKEIISEEITRKFVRWDKTITVAEWETFTRDVIDNAPTVEPCNDCEDRKQAEYIRHSSSWHELQALRKFKEEHDRPQGEWLKAQGEWVTDTAYKICFKCSECKSHFEFPFNFCPNCGAEMKVETCII